MQEFNLSIMEKIYILYEFFYGLRKTAPKPDRYAIWQKCDEELLGILENIYIASRVDKVRKSEMLWEVDLQLNFIKILVRFMKGVKTLDNKSYGIIKKSLDEIGRMLGGWMNSLKA